MYNLLICHQNMRDINNKIDELLSQWESNLPHVFCFTEHYLNLKLHVQLLNLII
jgi:hypothetical protein